LSFRRNLVLVLLGVLLGVGLTAGVLVGVREYAPELLSRILAVFIAPRQEKGNSPLALTLDPNGVRSLVQDILASEEGRTIIRDLVTGESRETLLSLLQDAMEHPEFRKTLGEALESFFNSPEGKDLIKRIAKEALKP